MALCYAEIDRCDIALPHPYSLSPYRLDKINQRSPIILTTTKLRIPSIMNRVSTGTDNDRDESTQSGDAKYPNERYTLMKRNQYRARSCGHSRSHTALNSQ